MTEIFVDEGLDASLGVFPRGGTNITTLYLGLFTSQTPSTVPARTAVGGAVPSGWTEAVGTAYARQAIAAASWGAPATNGNGRRVAAGQVTMPTVGAAGWGTINGFFIATNPSSGAGDKIIYFSNFDDGLAIIAGENDVIKVTPRMQYDG